jgi:hypothetical protein
MIGLCDMQTLPTIISVRLLSFGIRLNLASRIGASARHRMNFHRSTTKSVREILTPLN